MQKNSFKIPIINKTWFRGLVRTPEVKRVAKRQCFQKDNARKATWKFPSVETDCFQLIFLVFVSVSCCPHCHFISCYFCASWPVWCWYIVVPAKSRDSQFVVASSEFPSPVAPWGITSCQPNKAMAIPSSLVPFVRFSAGKMYVFLPQLHFGRLAPGWGAIFCSPLYVCVTQRQHLFKQFLLFVYFFFFLHLCCLVG